MIQAKCVQPDCAFTDCTIHERRNLFPIALAEIQLCVSHSPPPSLLGGALILHYTNTLYLSRPHRACSVERMILHYTNLPESVPSPLSLLSGTND